MSKPKDVMDTWPARIIYGVLIFVWCAAALYCVVEPWLHMMGKCK